MKLIIPKDAFNNPHPPRMFLCNTGKKKIGELHAYDVSLDGKWNSYSELSFSINRQYTDMITGETKIDPLFDKSEGLRKVYVENIGYFVIQDPDAKYSSGDTKTLSCFSSEYETASKYLENFYINTGEIDSKEVIYEFNKYGENAKLEDMYKLANEDDYKASENYYHRIYTDAQNYTYEQIQIDNEADYKSHFGENIWAEDVLYVHGYANVKFYDPHTPELSLLHLIFEKIPEWKIKNVDAKLWRKERKFSEDRIAVYDFLMNEVSETFRCVVIWDTEDNTVSFIEEEENGITEDNTVQTDFDTDIFISRENLASEINVKYSTDNIKTKLKVSGSDGLDVREINLGRNYIMNLDFYHTFDWMEQDLYFAYSNYLNVVKKYTPLYNESMQKWVEANKNWSNIMNAVPADGNVVLVGDEFKKLYCVYAPVNTAYTNIEINNGTKFVDEIYADSNLKPETQIFSPKDGSTYVVQGYSLIYVAEEDKYMVKDDLKTISETSLIKMLNLYHVDEDTSANKPDNILLRMKNSSSDSATVRIYDKRKIATSYNPVYKYYTKDKNDKYVEITISDGADFNNQKLIYGNNLYTNDYRIQSIVVRAAYGVSEEADEYPMSSWIKGDLTSKYMDLEKYNITQIGTMGAYLVLAKDEKKTENLQDFGVELLREKHNTYTTIFQTQTEAMFSQQKYQCIVQDEQPDGDYKDGTRWLDSDSSPLVLYVYNKSKRVWEKDLGNVPTEDKANYENYQRYMDNYEKLKAVQEVLTKKEREAEYYLKGFPVSNMSINLSLYQTNSDGEKYYESKTLEDAMYNAATIHFGKEYSINKIAIDQDLPLYTFTTSFDVNHQFVVYLIGTTPYVSYADSQGVHNMIMENIRDKTDMGKPKSDGGFFTEDQWMRLSPFIREDEFSDSNFLLTGYESEEERLKICNELMESADKELQTLSQPSLEFSMTMANILALPEFASLTDQFKLGNFVRVQIRDGYVKRARLLEVHFKFDDLSDFSCTFGNLITAKSEIDKHAELLKQAVTAGKQVATSAGDWQKAVDKSNKLEQDISNGLKDAALAVGSANGQSIVWDQFGIWGRKLIDGTIDQYEPEQFRLINNKLVFSNDGFETSKSVFGKYTIDGEERWGTLAEYITADTIEGKFLKGGKIEIGEGNTKFVVDTDGTVQIITNGASAYADAGSVTAVQSAVDVISQARQYRTELTYKGSTVFSDPSQYCIITCKIYNWETDITQDIITNGGKFSWTRSSNLPNEDDLWKPDEDDQEGLAINQIKITHKDVVRNAQFACQVEFDDIIFNQNEKEGE